MPPPAPLLPPDLHIPSSSSTVDVSIINTTATLHGIDAWKFIQPEIPGHPYLAVPCFSFLIQHPTLKRTLVFDLGVRKDWWNSSPFLTARFKAGGYRLHADKDVRDILGTKASDQPRPAKKQKVQLKRPGRTALWCLRTVQGPDKPRSHQ